MKKYCKTISIFSKSKFTCLLIILFVILLIIFIFNGLSYALIIGASIFICIFLLWLLERIFENFKYSYQVDFLQTYFGCLKRKKIYYKDVQSIVISNAVHTVKGGSLSAPIALRKRVTINGETKLIQYAYISLFSTDEICKYLKPQMNSLQLLWADPKMLYGTVCWDESLGELLSYLTSKIYILEDVYFRFRDQFNDILAPYCMGNENNIFIVVDDGKQIRYCDYQKSQNRNTGDS